MLHKWLKFNAHGQINRQAAQEPEVSDEARAPESETETGVDWSVTLGGGGTHVPRSTYPAKYTFDVSAAPDCTNDFVVFPTFNGGSAAQATVVAYNQLYSTQGSIGGLCNHNGLTVKWAYRTGRAIRSSPVL